MRYRLIFVLLGPFLMWSVYFASLYGAQAVGCRAGWDTTLIAGVPLLRLILVAALATSVVLSLAIYLAGKGEVTANAKLNRISHHCALAGLASTVIMFAGVFWLRLC